MDGTQIRIFKQVDQESLGGFLQGLNGLTLPAVDARACRGHGDAHFADLCCMLVSRTEIGKNGGAAYKSGKREFENQQVGRALVFANLAQGDGARFVAAGLLHCQAHQPRCFFGSCRIDWRIAPVPALRRGAFVLIPFPPVLLPPVVGRATVDVPGAIAPMRVWGVPDGERCRGCRVGDDVLLAIEGVKVVRINEACSCKGLCSACCQRVASCFGQARARAHGRSSGSLSLI